jgi:hypothetical protein
MLAFYCTPLGDDLDIFRGEVATVGRRREVIAIIRDCIVIFNVKEPFYSTVQGRTTPMYSICRRWTPVTNNVQSARRQR